MRSVHDPFDDDLAELTPTPTPALRTHEREGLPPGYRMRAEPHYVEQLTRRSVRPAEEAPRSSTSAPEPTESDPADRERLRLQIARRLAEGLGAIGSASALLSGDASPLARRTNIDLIRAEAWRAAWLVSSQALLDSHGRRQVRSKQMGPLLEQVRQGFAAECRLSGATLLLSASDWNAPVAVDEDAFVAGVTGAVIATFGVLGRIEGSLIRLAADTLAGDLRAIEVSQEEVSLPSSAAGRFFELGWAERPGGWIAGVGAAVTKAVAHQHGGAAVLVSGERRGTVVRMTLARGL